MDSGGFRSQSTHTHIPPSTQKLCNLRPISLPESQAPSAKWGWQKGPPHTVAVNKCKRRTKQNKQEKTRVRSTNSVSFADVNYPSVKLTEKYMHAHKRSHTVYFHLFEIPRIGESLEIESRLAAARGWEGRMESDRSKGLGFHSGGTEVLELDRGDSYITSSIH